MQLTEPQEHPVEFLAELALGVLPEGEATPVRLHIETCETCATEFAEMTRVTALLPYAAQEVAPSDQVRQRLFDRIAAEPKGGAAATSTATTPTEPLKFGRAVTGNTSPTPIRRWAIFAAMAAGLLLFAAGIGGFWIGSGSSNDKSNNDVKRYASIVESAARGTLAIDTAEAGAAHVRVMRSPGSNEAYAWVEGLPSLPSGKVYKAWYIQGGSISPSTAFTASEGSVWLPAPGRVDQFGQMGITIESDKDAKQPSQAPFVAVQLHSAARAR